MRSLKDIISYRTFTRKYDKNLVLGVIRPFDDEFYARFEGMYYDGLPIYYYLNPFYARGKCYDASAVLSLAMGDCTICRGDLKSQSASWGKDKLGHGWVEKDGYVYDTTWGIICPTRVYYKVFRPTNLFKTSSKKFSKGYKEITDWTIRDKKWYEENDSPARFLIFSARVIGQNMLERGCLDENQRKFWAKLLSDLPDETKAPTPSLTIGEDESAL